MRIDFINPLFEALGWDMENKGSLPEAYRQVVYEDALKIERTVKAPDYSFRQGGQRRFFLETKKVADNINIHKGPAYQLRRYAWTANLPVSLLSSFEETAVYDGRIAPTQDDSPKKARLEFYKYTDYLDKWDELYSRFSREAVESGAFDHYAEEEIPLFRGRQRVDAAFLQTIEGWRKSLAQAITLKNPALTARDLNRAVQTIIDRILFLRICEARGVEAEYKLQPAANGANVYPRLLQLFRHADDRYNSGLFHLKREPGRDAPDTLTPALTVDDGPLKEIIASLYYPQSPFEFSVMPADILGQVYEQFLGKVIRVDSGAAVVEEKPEVRKAGGVFYTPTYIVDYIVRRTVGRLVAGKTPKQVASVTVLDPACGSGSFLIGAYQFLLDWHTQWYVADGPEKHAKGKSAALYAGKGGAWRLTTAERKRILRTCIYGVDIDGQAVEVTKLSLLLKMLEGESAEVVDSNLKLFQERALPDLDSNIKCGNSLIGPDFYADQDMALFDTETKLRINVFDWQTEFAPIMGKGGFSAVIGNPPYISFYSRESIKPLREVENYLAKKYADGVGGRTNTFLLFLVQSLALKLDTGYVGMIVPDTLTNNASYTLTRSTLTRDGLQQAVRLDFPVFDGPTVRTVIPIIGPETDEVTLLSYTTQAQFAATQPASNTTISLSALLTTPAVQWRFGAADVHSLLAKMLAASVPLNVLAEIKDGINLGPKSFRAQVINPTGTPQPTWRPVLEGKHVTPYAVLPTNEIVNYNPALLTRELKSQGASFREARLFTAPKLVSRQASNTLIFALDETGYCTLNSVHNTSARDGKRTTLLYLLGLLNSKLLRFFYQNSTEETRIVFPQVHIAALRKLPIQAISFNDFADNPHDRQPARRACFPGGADALPAPPTPRAERPAGAHPDRPPARRHRRQDRRPRVRPVRPDGGGDRPCGRAHESRRG